MAKMGISAEEAGTRLLDLWSPGEGFGTPLGCVATTFTFDASHFEEQCLARFVAMETSPDEGARAYLIEREEKLSQVFSCVMVDQHHARDQRSLRWNLLPVRLNGGIQHAKLSLLLWDRHLRLIVGSANLTEPAYRRNLETVSCLDFDPTGGLPLELAIKAIDFLNGLAAFAPGNAGSTGPKAALLRFLAQTRRHIHAWSDATMAAGQPRPALVSLLPGEKAVGSVLDQLAALWRGPQPVGMTVVSPFFDQSASAINYVYGKLAERLTTRGTREITFRCTGRMLADGSVEAEIPETLFKAAARHRSTMHHLEIVGGKPASREIEAHRALHSKALVLQNDHLAVILIGSSNCTVKGLGLDPRSNSEMNLAYVVPSGNNAFGNQCLLALPPGSAVDLEGEVRFLAAEIDSEAAAEEIPLLPAGFDEALYDPAEGAGFLELHFLPDSLPDTFEIATLQGTVLLTANAGTPHSPRVRLPVAAPMSCLKVRWLGASQAWLAADWVVNVTDTGLLPPPSELASLNLEDLLAVLTSARPAHWLVAERLLAREARGQPSATLVVDPHKKVDTSQFLMRRMRRLSHALEGLRKRLELPLVSIEGLRWRLQGPFGPIALARALLTEAGPGAPFFILEIASTLQQIRWQASDTIPHADRLGAVSETLTSLKLLTLQDADNAPANLRQYVAAQLAELSV